MSPRLKRDPSPPAFCRGSAIRLSQALTGILEGYSVSFGRSRWERSSYLVEEDEAFLRWRTTRCVIEQSGRRVGALELFEYEAPFVLPGDFLDAMDGESRSMLDIATVLLSEWRDVAFDLFTYGRVVEISCVWSEPGHPTPRIWLPVLERLLHRIERDVAIVVALAFPLEYAGCGEPGGTDHGAFERRRKAMVRYYRRHAGLEPLPGPPGRKGWLWRPGPRAVGLIRGPRYRRLSFGQHGRTA